MQHAFLGILLLAMLTAAGLAAEPAELRVMTFNIRFASDRPPNAWNQRRPVVCELLEQESPDLIGTQEGVYEQLKDIEACRPEYAWIGLGRDGGSRGEFMAVFYRRERLEPLEFDHFWLSDTPEVIGSTTWGNTNRRMVTWVRFRDRQTEQQFYFFNTHFDHQVQPAREHSAELLMTRVDRLQTSLPVLLVGDFNALAEVNPVYQRLVAPAAFSDAWLTAQERGDFAGTFHGFRGAREGLPRIDWILTRGPVTVEKAEVITFAKDGQYPSDHFPVTATLRLGAP